jgi:hypothetical protein
VRETEEALLWLRCGWWSQRWEMEGFETRRGATEVGEDHNVCDERTFESGHKR